MGPARRRKNLHRERRKQGQVAVACVASAPDPNCAIGELAGAPVRAAARVRRFSVQASRQVNEAGRCQERHAIGAESATLKIASEAQRLS